MKRSFWPFLLLLAAPLFSNAQIEVVLTVKSGNATTSCTDFFGPADPFWSLDVESEGPLIYPASGNCYTALPNEQYRQTYACATELPAALNVCFGVFENDALDFELGTGCGVNPDCVETACASFIIPAPGDSLDNTLSLPAGGASGGSVIFTIASRFLSRENNDLPCDAVDLGVLNFGDTLGDARQGIYSNLCATSDNEINPFNTIGWVNNNAVWFTFTTGDDPGRYFTVEALSDPEGAGDSLAIELAVLSSSNGACDGNFRVLNFQFNAPELDSRLAMYCSQPNTRYYIMVDGGPALGPDRQGIFGLEIRDVGVVEGADLRCNAEDLGEVPVGGSISSAGKRSNFCATRTNDPFIPDILSENSVWFKFKAPPSGHIRLEGISDAVGVPLSVQLALFRPTDPDCRRNFEHVQSAYDDSSLDETMEAQCLYPGEELYVLVDGAMPNFLGAFSLNVYDAGDITPVVMLDTTICAGQSLAVAASVYTEPGTYRDTVPLFAGCDSIVITNLAILETIEATVENIQPAVGAGATNGVAEVSASGGAGQYTYQWCNGETGARNESLAGGMECCVTVTDEQGCSDVVCFDVLQVLPLQPSFQGDTLDCSGDANGELYFSIAEGRPPHQYAWRKLDNSLAGSGDIRTAGDTVRLSGLSAGVYEIAVQDIYFDTLFNVEIVEPAPLLLALDSLRRPTCNGFCNGRVFLETSGGNGEYEWLWPGNDIIGDTPGNVCAGAYEVSVTDAKGCQTSLRFNMTEPPPFLAEAKELKSVSCFGGADGEVGVNTNGRPLLFEWENGGSTAVLQNLPAGNYWVTVTNEDGCQAEASTQVAQPSEPLSVSIEKTALISCSDTRDGVLTAVVNGPGQSFSYRWSNGATLARNDRLWADTFYLTVTNEAGCAAEAGESLQAPPLIEAGAVGQDLTCLDPPDGGVIRLEDVKGGRPGYTYSLDGILFRSSPVFERLREGNYTLTVKDAADCEADFTAEIKGPPELNVSLGGDRVINLGETLELRPQSNGANLSIEWTPTPEGFESGVDFLEVQPVNSTRYSVTVTDNTTFCTASDNILVQVKKDRKLFMPNVFSPDAREENNRFFMIYGGLGIEQIEALRVFDRGGSLVFSAENFQPNDPNFAWDGTQNGQNLNSGVYVYVLEASFIDGEREMFSGSVTLFR